MQTINVPSWAPKLDPTRWVDNRLYTDPNVYAAEVDRIFLRSWLFAAHETELRTPNSFITTTIAGQHVLLTRAKDNRVRAFYNTCRHRGAKVVSEACGQAAALRCPYHFWSYDLDGRLIGVPGEEAYDGSGFRKEDFPLVELRCEVVLGLVFISFANEGPTLREFLGDLVIDTLSTPLANGSFEVIKYCSHELPINWKVFAENVRDGYHVPFVHEFFRKASPPGPYFIGLNGHAVQRLGMDPNGVEPAKWAETSQHTLPGVTTGDGYIVTFFPDATITLRSNVISIDSQRAVGPASVILESRVLGLASDTPEARTIREHSHNTWFLDPVQDEDFPIFVKQQEGVGAHGVRYSLIARGEDTATGTRGDDNRLRSWWAAWRANMGVEINSLEGENE